MRARRRRSLANSSARSSEPPSFLLREVLPDLAEELRHYLKAQRRDLADQIPELRIYGRCECGGTCGTFFCAPPRERTGPTWSSEDMVVWAVRNRITEIQTLDPRVDAVLRQLFPE